MQEQDEGSVPVRLCEEKLVGVPLGPLGGQVQDVGVHGPGPNAASLRCQMGVDIFTGITRFDAIDGCDENMVLCSSG